MSKQTFNKHVDWNKHVRSWSGHINNETVLWPAHLSAKKKGIYKVRIEERGKKITVRECVNLLF